MPKRIASRRLKRKGFVSPAQRKAAFAAMMAEKHQKLVHKVVHQQMRRLGPKAYEMQEDLTSAGNIGLMKFGHRFDKKRGAQFQTGAWRAIQAEVTQEFQRAHTVRVPEGKIKVEAKKGALPSTVQIHGKGSKAVREHLANLSESRQPTLAQVESRAQIMKMVKKSLSPQEQQVFIARKLEDAPVGTVAKKLKITPAKVRTLEGRALRMLKRQAKKKTKYEARL